jgi:hypothetical protein
MSTIIWANINIDYIRSISGELSKEGVYPLAFSEDCPTVGTHCFYEQPVVSFKPRLLIVESYSAADAELINLYFGNILWNIGQAPIPLSLFTPMAWADAKLMSKALLIDAAIVTPANRITFHIRVKKPMKFSAVIFGTILELGWNEVR